MSAPDPELDVVVGALVAAKADFVVVGGFAVIANRFVRATEDIDLLVPDDPANDRHLIAALRALDGVRQRDQQPLADSHILAVDHLRAVTRAGLIDVFRGGAPPLDFATVAERAIEADYGAATFRVAGLRSIVGFKRLADRPQDRLDLERLQEIHGELPIDPIPGLDDI
ncbi:MAG: hypothetical protein ACR2G3_11710 [Solirubrobacterales bacterium]